MQREQQQRHSTPLMLPFAFTQEKVVHARVGKLAQSLKLSECLLNEHLTWDRAQQAVDL